MKDPRQFRFDGGQRERQYYKERSGVLMAMNDDEAIAEGWDEYCDEVAMMYDAIKYEAAGAECEPEDLVSVVLTASEYDAVMIALRSWDGYNTGTKETNENDVLLAWSALHKMAKIDA